MALFFGLGFIVVGQARERGCNMEYVNIRGVNLSLHDDSIRYQFLKPTIGEYREYYYFQIPHDTICFNSIRFDTRYSLHYIY